MLELPEARVVADQLARTVIGKPVANVVAGQSPHRFAFFSGDPGEYDGALRGKEVVDAVAMGGFVELRFGGTSLLLNDGANLRYHEPGAALPSKHQLLVGFEDGSALTVTVQMYAGVMCSPTGVFDNPYYLAATSKPSPLTDAFDREWFRGLLAPPEVQRLSLKAALATEQRIPGFGNGVLQDVLWKASVHPRRRVSTLDDAEVDALFSVVTGLLREMAERGGRDTEVDLFGTRGGVSDGHEQAAPARAVPDVRGTQGEAGLPRRQRVLLPSLPTSLTCTTPPEPAGAGYRGALGDPEQSGAHPQPQGPPQRPP